MAANFQDFTVKVIRSQLEELDLGCPNGLRSICQLAKNNKFKMADHVQDDVRTMLSTSVFELCNSSSLAVFLEYSIFLQNGGGAGVTFKMAEIFQDGGRRMLLVKSLSDCVVRLGQPSLLYRLHPYLPQVRQANKQLGHHQAPSRPPQRQGFKLETFIFYISFIIHSFLRFFFIDFCRFLSLKMHYVLF